jgi:hypothetical protein
MAEELEIKDDDEKYYVFKVITADYLNGDKFGVVSKLYKFRELRDYLKRHADTIKGRYNPNCMKDYRAKNTYTVDELLHLVRQAELETEMKHIYSIFRFERESEIYKQA